MIPKKNIKPQIYTNLDELMKKGFKKTEEKKC
jgi:hypothetical protein